MDISISDVTPDLPSGKGWLKPVILYVAIAIVLFIIYKWYIARKAASTSTQVAATQTAEAVVNPVSGAATVAPMAANGTVSVPQPVLDFFNSLSPTSKADAYRLLPTMSAADIAGLYDLAQNVWATGKTPTAAQTNFWNSWRANYGIKMGSSFTGDKVALRKKAMNNRTKRKR